MHTSNIDSVTASASAAIGLQQNYFDDQMDEDEDYDELSDGAGGEEDDDDEDFDGEGADGGGAAGDDDLDDEDFDESDVDEEAEAEAEANDDLDETDEKAAWGSKKQGRKPGTVVAGANRVSKPTKTAVSSSSAPAAKKPPANHRKNILKVLGMRR
jgi:hypothetical protein